MDLRKSNWSLAEENICFLSWKKEKGGSKEGNGRENDADGRK